MRSSMNETPQPLWVRATTALKPARSSPSKPRIASGSCPSISSVGTPNIQSFSASRSRLATSLVVPNPWSPFKSTKILRLSKW